MPAIRRTKGLSNSIEELADGGPAHPHYTRQRQEAGGGERGKLDPRDSTPYQTAKGLQFLTKDFLRFWMVDIRRWEGRS